MCLMSAGFWETEAWDSGGLFGFFPSIFIAGKGNTVCKLQLIYICLKMKEKSRSSLVAHGQFPLPRPLQPLSCVILFCTRNLHRGAMLKVAVGKAPQITADWCVTAKHCRDSLVKHLFHFLQLQPVEQVMNNVAQTVQKALWWSLVVWHSLLVALEV